jgi:tetratricopeptide (TPR) repeat protein
VAVGVAVAVASCARPHPAPPSAYDSDLAALEREHADHAGAAEAPLGRAAWLQRRWALTGDAADLAQAWRLVVPTADAPAAGAPAELSLFAAAMALDLHRVADARRILARCTGCADAPAGDVVAADLALQDGRLDDAAAGYQRALRAGRRWDRLARLAFLRHAGGDDVAADALYAEAEEDVSSKEMRTFAWLEVQRGRLAFAHGRFSAALASYDRADRAYPGYWLVDMQRAEALAAEGRIAESLALYTRVATRTASPAIAQALGELYVFLGRPSEARAWIDRAVSAYHASVSRGEVHYLHHLAALYTDVAPDAALAVRWAEQDLALRPGLPAARDQLAWAYLRAGRLPDARREMRRALDGGTPDAHLLSHAAAIAIAAGEADEGARLFSQAAAINPLFRTTFHAHR